MVTRAAGLIAAATSATAVTSARLEDLLPNPENPRGDELGDLAEMASSMRVMGVLQPLLVCSSVAFHAARGATAPGGAEWVVLAGHRRLEAAKEAQLDLVPIVVRDDLAAPGMSEAIAVTENQQRRELDPLQEASAMALMRDRSGMSQADIARTIGCSPSHVTKRLQLLTLPEEIRRHVGGRIAASAALHLLEQIGPDPDERLGAAIEQQLENGYLTRNQPTWAARDLDSAVREARATLAKQDAAARLASAQVPVVDHIEWRNAIRDEAAIEAARHDGTLVAAVNHDGDVTYGTTRTEPDEPATEDAQTTERRGILRDLRTLREQRRAALPDALRAPMNAAERRRWVDTVAPMLVTGWGLEHEGRKLLAQLVGADEPARWDTSGPDWLARAGLDAHQALRACWVAQHERAIRVPSSTNEFHTMPTVAEEYRQWLAEVGLALHDVENAHYITRRTKD